MGLQSLFKSVIKYLFGIGVAMVLVYKIGLENIVNALVSVSVPSLMLILALMVVMTMLLPLPLLALYKPIQLGTVTPRIFYRERLKTQILGGITPNKVGEFYLFYIFRKKYKARIADIFYIFIMDKMITVISAVIVSAAGIFVVFHKKDTSTLLMIIIIAFIALLSLGAHVVKKLMHTFWRITHIKNLGQLLQRAMKFIHQYVKKRYAYLLINAVTTLALSIYITAFGKIVFAALGAYVSFFDYFVVINMITLASFIHFNVLGMGAKELSLIYLLSLIGVAASISTSAVIIVTVARYMTYFVFYFAMTLPYSRQENRDIRERALHNK